MEYRDALPGPEDILLAAEVSDATLDFDRRIKMPLYARHGIREAWIVNLKAGLLEIYQAPGPDGYADRREATPGQPVALLAVPSIEIEWSQALG